jgi:hypothetical protein
MDFSSIVFSNFSKNVKLQELFGERQSCVGQHAVSCSPSLNTEKAGKIFFYRVMPHLPPLPAMFIWSGRSQII